MPKTQRTHGTHKVIYMDESLHVVFARFAMLQTCELGGNNPARLVYTYRLWNSIRGSKFLFVCGVPAE